MRIEPNPDLSGKKKRTEIEQRKAQEQMEDTFQTGVVIVTVYWDLGDSEWIFKASVMIWPR